MRIPHTFGAYAPREYLRLLEPIGIHTDKSKYDWIFGKRASKADSFFRKKRFGRSRSDRMLAIGCGTKSALGDQKFAELLDRALNDFRAHA